MSPLAGRAVVHEQRLRHPFGTSRGIDATIPTVLLRLEEGAAGEGSPVRYLGQTAAGVRDDVLRLLESIEGDAPLDAQLAALRGMGSSSAAKCALDIALHDLHARREGVPLHRLVGLSRTTGRVSSLTIGLDEPVTMESKAREAAHWPILKVKLGRGPRLDSEALRRVRAAAPGARLTVDANAGWDPETASAMFPVLVECGVEVLEQPTRIGALDELAAVHRASPIAVIADEDAQGPECLPALRGRVRGINIKLMKCGGIAPAMEMARIAREEGWVVLLGCMVETGIGIGAARHLAPLADWLDLDGAALSTNDPTTLAGDPRAPWAVTVGEDPGIGVDWRG